MLKVQLENQISRLEAAAKNNAVEHNKTKEALKESKLLLERVEAKMQGDIDAITGERDMLKRAHLTQADEIDHLREKESELYGVNEAIQDLTAKLMGNTECLRVAAEKVQRLNGNIDVACTQLQILGTVSPDEGFRGGVSVVIGQLKGERTP